MDRRILGGLGHSVTILAVGGAIVVLGLVIPPRLWLSMEMSVALTLVVLGMMNVTGAMRRIDEVAQGANSGAGESDKMHALSIPRPHGLSRDLRPLPVGVVHGLAGSAAVALLVLATIRDPKWALLYLIIFGAGTVLGMKLLTGAMIVPLAALTRRYGLVERVMSRITGLVSLAFGLFLAYKIGILDGLSAGTPIWNPG